MQRRDVLELELGLLGAAFGESAANTVAKRIHRILKAQLVARGLIEKHATTFGACIVLERRDRVPATRMKNKAAGIEK